jgi:hypothetical protein
MQHRKLTSKFCFIQLYYGLMLVLQVARLDEYRGMYKQKETYSKLVKSKEKCCFETVLFIKHA